MIFFLSSQNKIQLSLPIIVKVLTAHQTPMKENGLPSQELDYSLATEQVKPNGQSNKE